MVNGLKLTKTDDGSVTVVDSSPEAGSSGEWMHNQKGALEESLHVYLPAFEKQLQNMEKKLYTGTELGVTVVGLGLGYLEMMCVAHTMATQPAFLKCLHLKSYESQSQLVEALQICFNFKQNKISKPSEETTALASAFEEVSAKVSNHFRVSHVELKETLETLLQQGQWTMAGKLSAQALEKSENKSQVILYDAYSSHSCPELWTPEFLKLFIEKEGHENFTSFATYASRTNLKKVLKEAGFALQKRKGFGGKRECTLAHKK